MEKRIIKTRMSAKDVSLLMSRAFKSLKHKRDKNARWCEITLDDFSYICDQLEMVADPAFK